MQPYTFTLPTHWDTQYIIDELAKVGITSYFGIEPDADTGEWRVGVHLDHVEAMHAIVDAYQTSYLAVLLPRLKKQVAEKRSMLLMAFTFNGAPIPLVEKTLTRITGAVVLLREEPSRPEVNWDESGLLEYTTIPRVQMLVLGRTAGGYVQALFDHAKNLGEALDAALTVDDALAVDLEDDWPTPESVLAQVLANPAG